MLMFRSKTSRRQAGQGPLDKHALAEDPLVRRKRKLLLVLLALLCAKVIVACVGPVNLQGQGFADHAGGVHRIHRSVVKQPEGLGDRSS